MVLIFFLYICNELSTFHDQVKDNALFDRSLKYKQLLVMA